MLRIMSAEYTFYDEHAKKWLTDKKKEINDRRKYVAARTTAARMQAEQAGRMQAKEAARMQAEQDEQDAFAWSTTHSARSRRPASDSRPSVMLGH